MKKLYIEPSVRAMEAETEEMIALSMVSGTADDSDALSRQTEYPKGQSVWDDEEE